MTLTVTGRHVELSAAVRQQLAKKIGRLDRLLNDNAISAQCIVTKERQLFVCEVTLHARGDHMMVGIGRHARVTAAAGAAVDKVAQQAKRLKDRWTTRRRRAVRPDTVATPVELETPRNEAAARVIKSRQYAVKPLSIEDATLALTSSSQPFLVFRQIPTDAVAVLYRRPDGNFGLIDTRE